MIKTESKLKANNEEIASVYTNFLAKFVATLTELDAASEDYSSNLTTIREFERNLQTPYSEWNTLRSGALWGVDRDDVKATMVSIYSDALRRQKQMEESKQRFFKASLAIDQLASKDVVEVKELIKLWQKQREQEREEKLSQINDKMIWKVLAQRRLIPGIGFVSEEEPEYADWDQSGWQRVLVYDLSETDDGIISEEVDK